MSKSGLYINFDKFRALYSRNVSHMKRDGFTHVSSIKFTTDLGRYLGFPLIQGRALKALFYEVLEKIQWRLASWKGHLLNRARCICLARFVMASIPVYSM